MARILYIGNKLQTKNHNKTYISVLGQILEEKGFSLTYASGKSNKVLRLLDMMYHVIKLHNSIDFVLIDTYSTQNFNFALIISQLCRFFKIDYIPILHGGNLPYRLKRNPKLSSFIFKYSKCNVSPSMYLKKEFETYGYNNIVHIPNAIQINDYPFHKRINDLPKLLWVRSFSKIYNPRLAILVFNEIKMKYPNATLCMVGPDADGSLKEMKEFAAELNLDIKFTGKLTKKEWILESENYNIFINTTNFDNAPVSVIEAMALGLPIVSTNVGGLPFLITDNEDGLLVDPNNIDAMVNAIIKLSSDERLRNKLVVNARSKVENFDWKEVMPLWESLLS